MRFLEVVTEEDKKKELEKIGVDPKAFSILLKKWNFFALKMKNLLPAEANILKQLSLEIGADLATHKNTITGKKEKVDVIFLGTERELEKLLSKLGEQSFNLSILKDEIKSFLQKEKKVWAIKDKEYFLDKNFWIMGILNITPDSFYDGGRYFTVDDAVKRAEEMIEEGVDVIDIGAESTRPGAEPISMDEEIKRLLPVLRKIRKRYDGVLSVDTYKPEVAKIVVEEGADVINDTSGAKEIEGMVEIIKRHKVGYVLMHIKGTPKTMQRNPFYKDVIEEIYEFFKTKLQEFESMGVEKRRIVLDPGIGFGKTVQHNLEIIKRARDFLGLKRPLLVGPSRKSFIGAVIDKPPGERLFGTIGACVSLFINGVSIFRVHDVREVREALMVVERIIHHA